MVRPIRIRSLINYNRQRAIVELNGYQVPGDCDMIFGGLLTTSEEAVGTQISEELGISCVVGRTVNLAKTINTRTLCSKRSIYVSTAESEMRKLLAAAKSRSAQYLVDVEQLDLSPLRQYYISRDYLTDMTKLADQLQEARRRAEKIASSSRERRRSDWLLQTLEQANMAKIIQMRPYRDDLLARLIYNCLTALSQHHYEACLALQTCRDCSPKLYVVMRDDLVESRPPTEWLGVVLSAAESTIKQLSAQTDVQLVDDRRLITIGQPRLNALVA